MRIKLLLLALPVALLPVAAYYAPVASKVAYWVTDAFVAIAAPAVLLLVLSKEGVRAADIGLYDPRKVYGARKLGLWTLLCVVVYWSYGPVAHLAGHFVQFGPVGAEQTYETYRLPSGDLRILAITYQALTAAFFEEIIFRGVLGFIFLEDASRRGRIAYPLCSASLFTAIHVPSFDPAHLIGLFYLGIASAILYLRFRNLWPLILAHFVLDVAVLSAGFLETN